jgi:hypothetical protein
VGRLGKGVLGANSGSSDSDGAGSVAPATPVAASAVPTTPTDPFPPAGADPLATAPVAVSYPDGLTKGTIR